MIKNNYNKWSFKNKTIYFDFRKKPKNSVGTSTLFLKHLIQTDFLFSKSITKNHSNKLLKSTIHIEKNNNFHTMDILKLNKHLKVFIRLLQGIRDNQSFCIHIWCCDGFITKAVNIFLVKYNLTKYIKITRLFPSIDSDDDKKVNFLLILGKPWIQTSESLIENWVFLNRTFLVTKMNFAIENTLGGFYKIQNELADYKKLFFILVLIQKVILKTTAKKVAAKDIKKRSKTQKNSTSVLKVKKSLNKSIKKPLAKIVSKKTKKFVKERILGLIESLKEKRKNALFK